VFIYTPFLKEEKANKKEKSPEKTVKIWLLLNTEEGVAV
jgi:hypothetical protein